MTGSPALAHVLSQTRHILLDFDGPVTHLFIDGRNRMVADHIRDAIPDRIELPDHLADTHDPMALLTWAGANLDPDQLDRIEAACTDGETTAAEASTPILGVAELLGECATAGRRIIIVSNNAEQPIQTFLAAHHLGPVAGIVGRIPGRPDLMKPNPILVTTALQRLGAQPDECAMIGDSVSDIEVSTATGVRSIGYAKNTQRGQELRQAGTDALVSTITELAHHPGLHTPA